MNTSFVRFDTYIVLMHSHSYFITHLHYFIIIFFIHFLESILDPQSFIEIKVRDIQQNSVLALVLFCVMKEIFCTHNLLVSILFSASELMYPIGIFWSPRHWKKALSVIDLWSHFVNQNMREFAQVISCSRSCILNSS